MKENIKVSYPHLLSIFTIERIEEKNINNIKSDIMRENYKTEVITINNSEREVTTAVLVDENGMLYGGYSIRNPEDKSNIELSKQIAKGRALSERTNLLETEYLSYGLATKVILRSINIELLHRIGRGDVIIKGVK